MKKLFSTIFFVLIAILGMAQKLPDWIINKPAPTNSTYLYVVESATGQTEMQARNRAIGEVFRSTAMRIGQPFDSEEINRALQRGTEYYVISSQYNIPINKVCEYTDNKTSPCRVYVLCQVAKAGNIHVEFDDFNSCYEGVNKYYAAEALAADGFDVFRNGKLIKEPTVRSILANSRAYGYYEQGMNIYKSTFWYQEVGGLSISEGISYIILAAGGTVAVVGYTFAPLSDDELDKEKLLNAGKAGLGVAAVGGAFLLVRAGVIASGKAKIRKAVNLYNNGKMYSQGNLDMEYGLGENGVYLTFSF